MSSHQASEQMIGYLYQVRYALALLLANDNSDFQISIEKFDDVAFSKNDVPKQLIQLKHHVRKQGSLTDGSTDLWRTLKVDRCNFQISRYVKWNRISCYYDSHCS